MGNEPSTGCVRGRSHQYPQGMENDIDGVDILMFVLSSV